MTLEAPKLRTTEATIDVNSKRCQWFSFEAVFFILSAVSLIQCYGQVWLSSGWDPREVREAREGKGGQHSLKTFGQCVTVLLFVTAKLYLLVWPILRFILCQLQESSIKYKHSKMDSNGSAVLHSSLVPLFIAPYTETVSAPCHWKKLDRVEEKGRRPRHLPPPPPPPPPRQLHQRFIKKPTMLPLILSQPSHCVATLVILESPVSYILCHPCHPCHCVATLVLF